MGKKLNELIDALSGMAIIKEYTLEEKQSSYEIVANIISNKYSNIITKEEILEKLNDRGNVYFSDLGYASGIYANRTRNIHLEYLPNKVVKITSSFIHEAIHKLQGDDKDIDEVGFLEGATEYLVNEVWNLSTIKHNQNGLTFNLPFEITYVEQIAILKQMEHILGNKQDLERYALRKDRTFLEKFSKEYGEELFVKIREELNEKEDLAENINELQNEILYNCYDKKFEKINLKSKEELTKYLFDLKNFEKTRIIYEDIEKDGKIDNTFEKYYKEKYETILNIFNENKWSKEELRNLEYDEDYSQNLIYQNSNYRNEDIATYEHWAPIFLKEKEDKNFNYDNYEILRITKKDNEIVKLLRRKNDNKILEAVRILQEADEDGTFKKTDFINTSNSILVQGISINENNEAYEIIEGNKLKLEIIDVDKHEMDYNIEDYVLNNENYFIQQKKSNSKHGFKVQKTIAKLTDVIFYREFEQKIILEKIKQYREEKKDALEKYKVKLKPKRFNIKNKEKSNEKEEKIL